MNSKISKQSLREHIKKTILEMMLEASDSGKNNPPSDCSAGKVGDEFFFKKPDGVLSTMDIINSIPKYEREKIINQLKTLSTKCNNVYDKRKEERETDKFSAQKRLAQSSRQSYKIQDESVIKEDEGEGGGDSDGGDSMSESKKPSKWIQGAVKKPGSLHKILGIPEDEKIPVSLLKKKKKELMEKGEGDKVLSASDKKLLQKITFALNVKKVNESLVENYDEFGRKLYKDKHDGFAISNQDPDYEQNYERDYEQDGSNIHEETIQDSITVAMKDHMLHHAVHGTKPEEWDVLDLIDDIMDELDSHEIDYLEENPQIIEELKGDAIRQANSVLISKMKTESKEMKLQEFAPPGEKYKDLIQSMKKKGMPLNVAYGIAWKTYNKEHKKSKKVKNESKTIENDFFKPTELDKLSQSLISFLVYKYKKLDVTPEELDAETILDDYMSSDISKKFSALLTNNISDNQGISVNLIKLINNAKIRAQNIVDEIQIEYRKKIPSQKEDQLGESKKQNKSLEIDLETADPDLLLWFINNKHNGFKPRIRRVIKSATITRDEEK